MIVEKNKIISIQYNAKDENGNVVDSNMDFEPLEYLHGHNNILQSLENELTGLKPEEEKNVVLSAEQAYGEFNPELVIEVSRDQFPEGANHLQLGTMVQSSDGLELMVTDMDGEKIILDGNHPLAGKTLHFSVTIKSIREATEEEIAHGHAHNAHTHHHHSHDQAGGGCGDGCGCSH